MPTAVETIGYPVGQMGRGDRLEASGVQNDQVAAVGAGVVHESHQYPVVLRGLRSMGHEAEPGDAFTGAQPRVNPLITVLQLTRNRGAKQQRRRQGGPLSRVRLHVLRSYERGPTAPTSRSAPDP